MECQCEGRLMCCISFLCSLNEVKQTKQNNQHLNIIAYIPSFRGRFCDVNKYSI